MRKIIIVGNWKMNKTVAESVELAQKIVIGCERHKDVTVVIAPTYLALAKVSEVVKGTTVKLAAQDVHWSDSGAFTGKISADMLRDIGVEYVIVGHSEQRAHFSETNASVNMKVQQLLSYKMTPIICIGETLSERNNGNLEEILAAQIFGAYKGIAPSNAFRTVIAYEPIWAIGTGNTASNEEAQHAHQLVRKLLVKRFGVIVANSICIQYGGSMKPENAYGLLTQKDVDGGLIGAAALSVEGFLGIVSLAVQIGTEVRSEP